VKTSASVSDGPLIHDVQPGKYTAAHVTLIDREAMLELLRCREVNVTARLISAFVPNDLLVDDLGTTKNCWFQFARSSTETN
jgi:hypothetical protein